MGEYKNTLVLEGLVERQWLHGKSGPDIELSPVQIPSKGAVRMEDLTAQDLGDAVHGDFRAFAKLLYQRHEVLRKAQGSLTELTLGITDLQRVLVAFGQGLVQPEELGQWASFIRRGYIASGAGMRQDSSDLLVPLNITYDPRAEEVVSNVIARLDEIGDIIDGEIAPAEVSEMLQELTTAADSTL